MDVLAYSIIFGAACAYLVRVLLLEPKTTHEGPFKLKSTFVFFPQSNHVQMFAFFDIIRLFFGVYKWPRKAGFQTIFEVRDSWISEVWTCPVCLSFWAALPFTAIYFLLNSPDPLFLAVFHFAVACWSLLFYRFTEI